METALHLCLPQKVVLHSHAAHINAILCSKQSSQIIGDLFAEYNYTYVPYVTPGYDLFDQLRHAKVAPIVFLENHGIVVADDHPKAAFSTLLTINQICKDWLYHQADLFVDGGKSEDGGALFPDAALFPEKTRGVTDMLLSFMAQADLTPNFLQSADIEKIRASKFETYRKSLE
jgi:rhamnose utilization protein RhaD (predicted bifunctional aldolase and dehydrogenase)